MAHDSILVASATAQEGTGLLGLGGAAATDPGSPASSNRARLLTGLAVVALSGSSLCPAVALAQATPTPTPGPQADPPATGARAKVPTPAGREPSSVKEVTVKGASQATVRTSIDRQSYSVSADLKGANGSLSDALRNIPGAQVDLNGNLTMRGGPVQVMVDGQPSQAFNGPQGAQALQSLPADRIDRIEVINNPTAAYSPEGQGGIINLITKKQAPTGPSGGLRANVGTNDHENVGGNFVYQKRGLSVSGDAAWQRARQTLLIDTTGTVKDPITGLDDSRSQSEFTIQPNIGWNAHAGFSYQIDPKDQLTGDVRYQDSGVLHPDNYSFLTTDPSGTPIAAYTRTGSTGAVQKFSSEQLTWRRQLPGHDHTLVLFYNHSQPDIRVESPSDSLTTVPGPPSSLYQDQLAKIRIDINEFKADYTRPMPMMGQLKAGYDLRISDDSFDNSALFGATEATAAVDPLYTNVFRYAQMVNAEYVTYEQPFGDLTVLGGLRLEEEHLDLNQITQSTKVERDDVGLFPSLHLGWRQSGAVTWILNYSLRIQRPNPQDLNPYRNLTNPYDIRVGNPNLQNEQTHSFEAGWQYRKGATTYIATAFYRLSDHTVTDVVTDLGGGVLQTTKENVASGKVGGLELVAAAPISKTLSYNVSANFSYTRLETPVLGVRQIHEGFNAGGRATLTWQPTKKDTVQLIGIINQGRITAQGTVDPLLILAAGYRHKINDKFSLLLQTQDPFDTTRQYSHLVSAGLDQKTVVRAHIRSFMIGFTYNFGANTRPQPNGFDVGNGGLS